MHALMRTDRVKVGDLAVPGQLHDDHARDGERRRDLQHGRAVGGAGQQVGRERAAAVPLETMAGEQNPKRHV